MSGMLLEVSGLICGYGDSVVLSDVDFSLREGRSLALLGRNGTGKTTLIDTLVGVTRRHAGRIMLAGRAIQALPAHARAGGEPRFYCAAAKTSITRLATVSGVVWCRHSNWFSARQTDFMQGPHGGRNCSTRSS